MQVFETIIIFRPDMTDAHYDSVLNKYKKRFQRYSKEKAIKFENMGKKKLAYEIKKDTEGYYVTVSYEAKPDDITEIERILRIDDDVLKFMTVKSVEETSLEDLPSEKEEETEQEKPDAYDVLLGLANYR